MAEICIQIVYHFPAFWSMRKCKGFGGEKVCVEIFGEILANLTIELFGPGFIMITTRKQSDLFRDSKCFIYFTALIGHCFRMR